MAISSSSERSDLSSFLISSMRFSACLTVEEKKSCETGGVVESVLDQILGLKLIVDLGLALALKKPELRRPKLRPKRNITIEEMLTV